MLSDRMTTVLEETRRLRRRFAHTAPRPWDVTTATTELAVQLGHLALCWLRHRGADISDVEDPERPIVNIGDELADIVLAALSVAVLADTPPEAFSRPGSATEHADDAVLRLVVVSGALAETALVEHGYRHQPAGRPCTVGAMVTDVIHACEALAATLDINLDAEFDAMVADADRFLDSRKVEP